METILYYQNVNGLRTKLNEFKLNLSTITPKPNIILLSETKLSCDYDNNELGLHNYSIYRHDRFDYSNSTAGGGVLIAIENSIYSHELDISSMDKSKCEQKFCEIILNKNKYIVGAVYIPPKSSLDIQDYYLSYKSHKKTIKNLKVKYPDHEFIICGDFNLSKTNWNNSESLSAVYFGEDKAVADNVRTILNCYTNYDFFQYFPELETKGYSLDLLFSTLNSNDIEIIKSSDYLVKVEIRNHIPSFFKISDFRFDNIIHKFNNLNFYEADFNKLNQDLSAINWQVIFKDLDLDSAINKFYLIINQICTKLVPASKNRNLISTYPKWYSNKLISLIINKKKSHKIWIQTNCEEDKIIFQKLRAQCIRKSKIDFSSYMKKIESKTLENIKKFWSYVGSQNGNNELPNQMFLNAEKAYDPIGVSNLFAKNFESVYTCDDTYLIKSGINYTDQVFNTVRIEDSDVFKILNDLKPSHKITSDSLPNVLLKNCASTLSFPLCYLFNKSLDSGYVPNLWKISYVTPVYKEGDRRDVKNYRPISNLGSISKVFDKIVSNKLTNLIAERIVKEQHGFLKGRSTLTNLILYNDYLINALAKNIQVDSIYLDFSKAFDKVDHSILLNKLFNYGIGGKLLDWIASYLTGRTQHVDIKGHFSVGFTPSSGVPQGSHLGPFLFLLFINDITSDLKYVNTLIFADDVKLYFSVKNPTDCSKIQRDLDCIVNWSHLNKLALNITKCKKISFCKSKLLLDYNYQIGNIDIVKVDHIKDLGIIFDNKLNFKQHLEYITKKARKSLGFIIRSSSNFRKPETFLHLYKTIVLPLLLYGSQIWTPCYDTDIIKLEKVNHKFLRYLSYKDGNPIDKLSHNYEFIASKYSVGSIKSLHNINDATLTFKIIRNINVNHGEVVDLFPSRELYLNIRNPRQLLEVNTTLDYVRFSTVNRLRNSWNLLPPNIRNCNCISLFKNEIRSYCIKYE